MVTERVDIIVNVKGDRNVIRALDQIGQRSQRAGKNVDFLRRATQALGGALVIRKLVATADAYNLLQNRLRVVTGSQQELLDTQKELFQIANDSRSSIEGVAAIYSRFALALRDTNVEQKQLLNLTENVTKAAIIGGAAQNEARAGLIQLSQALASNRLSGDELRSVLEQLPVVAQKIAKELGVGVGELRKLGEAGVITREVLLGAFGDIDEELQEQFAKTVPTISQSVTVLNNALIKAVGEFDAATGASAKFAKLLIFLSNNLDIIGKSLTAIAIILGPILAVKVIPSLIAAFKVLGTTLATILANPLFLLGALIAAAFAFREELGKLKGPIGQVGQALDEAFNPRHLQNIKDQEEAVAVHNARAAAGIGVFEELAVSIEKEAKSIELANEKRKEQLLILQGTEAAIKSLNKPRREANELERERIDLANKRVTAAKEESRIGQAALKFQQKFNKQNNAAVEGAKALSKLLADGSINVRFYKQEFNKLVTSSEKLVTVQSDLNDSTSDLVLLTKGAADIYGILNEKEKTRIGNLESIEELLAKGLTTEQKAAELRAKVLRGEDLGKRARKQDSPLESFFKDIQDFSTQSEQVLVNAFQSAEDALVEFVQTGKFNFSGLVDSILADLTRLLARQALASLIGALGGAAGGGGAGALGSLVAGLAGSRANGGPVQGGKPFLVGERGPEIFRPPSSGNIVPNEQMGGASVTVINVTSEQEALDAMSSTDGEQVILNVIGRNKEAVKRAVS